MVRKKNRRLTHKESVQIETLLHENKTKAYIAKTLNKLGSTISREVNKWVQNKSDKYRDDLANWNTKDDYLNKICFTTYDDYNKHQHQRISSYEF